MKTQPLAKQVQKLQKQIHDLRIQHQLCCKHEHIIEAPWEQQKYFNSLPEFRVCRDCGFTENGWDCGFQILKRVDENLSRDEAQKFQVGQKYPNHYFVRDGDILDKKILYERAIRGECRK